MKRLKNKYHDNKFYGRIGTKLYTRSEFWKIYTDLRVGGLESKRAIASAMNMSVSNLYKRLNEDPKKYKKIESKFTKIMSKNN